MCSLALALSLSLSLSVFRYDLSLLLLKEIQLESPLQDHNAPRRAMVVAWEAQVSVFLGHLEKSLASYGFE